MRIQAERHRVASFALEARMQGSPVTLRLGEGPTQCVAPVWVDTDGRPDPAMVGLGLEPDRPVFQTLGVRCRQCSACLRHRARLWTARAISETKQSARTWFGTLTLAPDRQVWARYAALQKLERRASDVTSEAVFGTAVGLINPELTRFLKRVRKTAPFRYLLVTEKHRSGLPHFHILIHEYAGRISKRVLDDKWRYGFSQFRLVDVGDERACGYVCKYLSKSAQTRVRASAVYGQCAMALTERLVTATRLASEAQLAQLGGQVLAFPQGRGDPDNTDSHVDWGEEVPF